MGSQGVTEFLLGGIATSCAGFFTNPLEVAKTRMQLQGELKPHGQYSVHYRNAIHALFTIARTDGVQALQSGLVPALWYQFFMNGSRLGTFQIQVNLGLTKDKNGKASFPRTVLAGAIAGCVGSVVGSPLYLVKTQLQARANQKIAVGHQHPHESMSQGLRTIFAEHGPLGLWRGVSGAIARVTVGSAAQLSSFSMVKSFLEESKVFKPNSILTGLTASMIGGVAVTLFMTPFDVVSTRLYNQPVSATGQGLHYSGVPNCFWKIFRSEGFWGFYKGWGPAYLRLGPHTTLSLVFWDQLRQLYYTWKEERV